MSHDRRVVVTGMGVLTPLGLTLEETWSNLCQGKSGIDFISAFETRDIDVKIGGEIKGFDPLNFVDRRTARRMSRTAHLAVAAAKAAIDDARLALPDPAERVGICVGTAVGCFDKSIAAVKAADNPSRVEPFAGLSALSNMPSALIAIAYQLNGPSSTIVTGCAAGSQAVGEAAEQIRRGWAESMICGGVDALVLKECLIGFNAMGAMSRRTDNPAAACKPFDREREGLVMSEGSAFFVLEERQHALDRKARIYGEVMGSSATTDCSSLFAPDALGDAAAEALRLAVARSGLTPEDIGYIHAHGTATRPNDVSETRAIKSVFGPHAYRVPISSSKSMMGHTMGASGAIGLAIALKVIQEGVIPPTINLNTPDPECDLDYVPNQARAAQVRNVLVNAFGMGGQNACLVVGEMA